MIRIPLGVAANSCSVWPHRKDPVIAKQNYGPQGGDGKTCMVYHYSDEPPLQHLITNEEMKDFYTSHKIDWKALYAFH